VPEHREQIAISKPQNQSQKDTLMPKTTEQRREEAIRRYLKGEKIEHICSALSCSKSFLYTWRKRFNAARRNDTWTHERSRRPLTNPSKTPEAIAQMIRRLYDERTENHQMITAEAIRQALERNGITPLPSLRTIYRILSRHKRAPPEKTGTS
jgi:transposase